MIPTIAFRELEEGEFFIDPNEEKPWVRMKVSPSLSWAYKRSGEFGREQKLAHDIKHSRDFDFGDLVIKIEI